MLERADGTPIDVLISCAYPKQGTERVPVVVGLLDISSRVAKDRELARAQADLAHAARVATLGELMASIAHEVNQPLAAVVANGHATLRWLDRDIRAITLARDGRGRLPGSGIGHRHRDDRRSSHPSLVRRARSNPVKPRRSWVARIVGRPRPFFCFEWPFASVRH